MHDQALLDKINAGGFSALDLGCGSGGSAPFIRKRFGFSSVAGIEVDNKKAALAREAGLAVLESDARRTSLGTGVVSAAFMFHFLEHLPSLADATEVIRQACRASRDFVLVSQPFFGADEELMSVGIKLAWSTWRCHTNKMTALDFYAIFDELQRGHALHDFAICYAIPIPSSSDRQVLPLSAERDDLFYEEAKHGSKPSIRLHGVYREVCAIGRINPRVSLDKIQAAARVSERVFPQGRPRQGNVLRAPSLSFTSAFRLHRRRERS